VSRLESAPVARPGSNGVRQAPANDEPPAPASGNGLGGAALRDGVLTEARNTSKILYNTVLAQAQKLEVHGDRLVLTFASSFKFGPAFEKYRATLESIASKLAGRKIVVEADGSGVDAEPTDAPVAKPAVDAGKQAALKEQALADSGVQALLEVFPAEIRDIEEM
jgi:hypothetical protein